MSNANERRTDGPSARDHWSSVAQRWQLVGSPLRPADDDIRTYRDTVTQWAAQHGSPRALILGVTPELYHLPWPAGTELRAVDHTQAMIEALWPGDRAAVLQADWTNIPLPASAIDLVLCDGGFHLLPHPDGQSALVQSLARVLSAGGLFIVRLFVPPRARETPEQVLQALDDGAIPNLNVLKLRLGMALQNDATEGVQLHQVWNTLHERHADFVALAARLGWQLDHLQAIDSYRNSDGRYHFVDVSTVQAMFCADSGPFELISQHTGSYPLSERCPIVLLRRRANHD